MNWDGRNNSIPYSLDSYRYKTYKLYRLGYKTETNKNNLKIWCFSWALTFLDSCGQYLQLILVDIWIGFSDAPHNQRKMSATHILMILRNYNSIHSFINKRVNGRIKPLILALCWTHWYVWLFKWQRVHIYVWKNNCCEFDCISIHLLVNTKRFLYSNHGDLSVIHTNNQIVLEWLKN